MRRTVQHSCSSIAAMRSRAEGSDAGLAGIGADGDDKVIFSRDCRRVKVPLRRCVGNVHQQTLSVGGHRNFMVDGANIGCGKDERGAFQVTFLIGARDSTRFFRPRPRQLPARLRMG